MGGEDKGLRPELWVSVSLRGQEGREEPFQQVPAQVALWKPS